jgi:hypothetical protein
MLRESRPSFCFCIFFFSLVFLLLCLADGFALVNITAVFFYKRKVRVAYSLKKHGESTVRFCANGHAMTSEEEYYFSVRSFFLQKEHTVSCGALFICSVMFRVRR